jgi:hypothetical protein
METIQHTAGTWLSKEGQIYPQETGRTIALIPYYSGTPEQDANAQLMAAAPELLEALVGTMKALGRMIDKYNPDDIEAEWIGNAFEAIQNATNRNIL